MQTNGNEDSGSVGFRKALQELLRLPLVCESHFDPLPLRWKMVLWFPLTLKGSHKGAHKDLESLLGNNRLRLVHMRLSFFPPSFITFILESFFSFFQKIEITEQDPKTSIYCSIKIHIYIKDHNYTKVTINSPQKTLVSWK